MIQIILLIVNKKTEKKVLRGPRLPRRRGQLELPHLCSTRIKRERGCGEGEEIASRGNEFPRRFASRDSPASQG